jgi:hypothetical protein
MTPLERITERVNRNGDVNDATTPRPLLTLDEFFLGNEVVGSIAANLTPTPAPAEFFDLLRQIASRPEVADVRIQVKEFDDPVIVHRSVREKFAQLRRRAVSTLAAWTRRSDRPTAPPPYLLTSSPACHRQ